MKIETEILLEGNSIVLIPLEMKYKDSLFEALKSPEVWKYTWREVKTIDDFEPNFMAAIQNKEEGKQIPFIIKDKVCGKVIGTTRIGDIDLVNRSVEIGWTWLSPSFWRTGANTECKFLCFNIVLKSYKSYGFNFQLADKMNVRKRR